MFCTVDLDNQRIAATEVVNGQSYTWFIKYLKWTQEQYDYWFVVWISQENPERTRALAKKLCQFYDQQQVLDKLKEEIEDHATEL